MSSDKDLTHTYVLEETAMTKAMSLEELAEIAERAAHQDEKRRSADVVTTRDRVRRANREPSAHRLSPPIQRDRERNFK